MPRPNAPDPQTVRAELLAPFVRDDVTAFDAGAFDRLLQHPQAFAAWMDDEGDDEEDDCPYEVCDSVAVLKVRGGLAQRGGRFWCWSWPGYDTLAADIARACDDSSVRALLLAIDSPGGTVCGLFDGVRAMRDKVVASKKPCVAVADEHCYSAAYALACVADEIVVPQTGGLGSVGVITSLTSLARMYAEVGVDVRVIASGAEKADGHPALPITKEAEARAAFRVSQLAEVFTGWVAERRGMKPAAVQALQAGIRIGDTAIAAGLADRSATLAATLADLQARVAPKPTTAPMGLLNTTTTQRPYMSLLALLGAADEAAAVAAVQSLTSLRTQVHELTGTKADAEALGTLHALKRDAAAANELRVQLEADRTARVAAERKELLAAAVTAMKLTPAEAAADGAADAWTTPLSNDALKAFSARAGAPGTPPRQPAKGVTNGASLTDDQKAIATSLGLDFDAYAKALAAQG